MVKREEDEEEGRGRGRCIRGKRKKAFEKTGR